MKAHRRIRRREDLVERRPIVLANWKMYLGAAESLRAAKVIRLLLGRVLGNAVDVVLCPSFPILPDVRRVLEGSRLMLGAQDVHHEVGGPYTGDVPMTQLKGLVRYVIVGHSERRQHHRETDALVRKKVARAVAQGVHPVICVGETAEEREEGKTVARITEQLGTILQDMGGLSLARCVIAYEPIWAISAGLGQPAKQPDPTDVVQIIGLIRKRAAEHVGNRYAERLRIVYGGSVGPRGVGALAGEPSVDGFLVGASSTKPADFAAIVKEVLRCR